ncbi:MAG: hypothetical protein AAFO29_05235 [Actinomycetota bacterium]
MLIGGALVMAGCGGESEYPPLRADLGPGTTLPSMVTAPTDISVDVPDVQTTGDGSTTEEEDEIVATGDWQDVTANLEGLSSSCGNVSFVSAHPETSEVMVNISTRGLFALSDESDAWDVIGSSIDHRTQWVDYDPEDPDRFWVSGAYGTGVYRTLDGGSTFSQLGSIDHVDQISVDETDPDRQTILAGKHEETSLMLSTNGGSSWRDIAGNLPTDVGFTSAPLIQGSVFFVGSYQGDAAGIYRSEDGGETWEQVYDGAVIGGPVATDDYIAWNLDGGAGGLAVSRDGGETFERSGSTPGGRSTTLVPIGDGRLATVSRNGIAVTNDVGDSWDFVGPQLDFQPVGVAYSPERSSYYVWTFTCNFGDEGNPVLPRSIMELSVEDSAS